MDLLCANLANYSELIKPKFDKLNGTNQIVIPHYQRPYSWDGNMVSRLINDWYESSENTVDKEQSKYFSGSIVTALDEKDQQLVDGQQRFTTIFILNYLKLQLLRVLIREKLTTDPPAIPDLVEDYFDTFGLVFHSSRSNDVKNKHIAKIKELLKYIFTTQGDNTALTSFKNYVSEIISIPSCTEISDGYKSECININKELLASENLYIKYHRKSYNDDIRSALASFFVRLGSQTGPNIELADKGLLTKNDEELTIRERYVNSAYVLFDEFYKLVSDKKDSIEVASSMLNCISKFMRDVEFCLIATGNIRDAYTLFEVLNDRAMTLSDLDLIKNDFYKKYCLSNKGVDSNLLDHAIESRDKQWGDKIFPEQSPQFLHNYTSYFYSVLMSGLNNYKVNNKVRHREAINQYLESKRAKKFSNDDFEYDFNVLEMISTLLRHFSLRHKSKESYAVKVDYSDCSDTYKCFHYLNAVGQDGVLSALVTVIIKYYLNKNQNQNIDINLFVNYLAKLENGSKEYSDLDSFSRNLMRCSIMAKDHSKPKELSDSVIKNNAMITDSSNCNLSIDSNILKGLDEEFENYLENWRYRSGDIRIRVLFSRLIRSIYDETTDNLKASGEGFFYTISKSLVDGIQLDHMEPQKIDQYNIESYFSDSDREYHINSIGNIFPLISKLNQEKSNRPFRVFYNYMKKQNLHAHWFVKKIIDNFEENNEDKVPNKKFFTKQKSITKKYFKQVVSTWF